MDKPVTLVREELIEDINKAISKANLPAFAVADLLEHYVADLRMIERQQLEADRKAYADSTGAENV